MKEVMAVIRMNKVNRTKEALVLEGFPSLNCRKVMGRDKKKVDYLLIEGIISGMEVTSPLVAESLSEGHRLIPKRLLSLVVKDDEVGKVVDIIVSVNRTESPGDGKIFVVPVEMANYKKMLNNKTAALFVGGSRAHHYQHLLVDPCIKTVLAGYEFAHKDDYEGREVKEDADSKNIESIEVEEDTRHYRVFLSKERYEELKNEISLNYYGGMIKEMPDGSIVVDDLNHYETEEFLKVLKPDIFLSGIKDKYIAHKAGIFSKQLHSYDYSGPYAAFKGAANFARDIAMGYKGKPVKWAGGL